MENIRISKEVLQKRRSRLLRRPEYYQKKALKKVKIIALKCFGFRIQEEKVFSPYILDIFINTIRCGIEIDGLSHKNKGGYDNRRDRFLLETYHVEIFRFTIEEFLDDKYFKQALWEICLQGLYKYILRINAKANKLGYRTFKQSEMYSFKPQECISSFIRDSEDQYNEMFTDR